MGQAKQRGTFEQRRVEACAREVERIERKNQELAERKEAQRLHDLANPKQAAARRVQQRRVSQVLSSAILMTAGMDRPRSIPTTLTIDGKYRWKGQQERLVYMGHNWSGNGYWHQFEKEDEPGIVWCEVLDRDLDKLEAR